MTMLEPYKRFRPSAFDQHHPISDTADGETRETWYVAPVSITRDTDDPIDLSNWRVFKAELEAVDPDGEDHEVHRFGHWGPGWFEIILVRPESEAAARAQELADRMSDYCILDESDYSELATENEERQWTDWGRFEFKRALVEYFPNADMWPDAALDWLVHAMVDCGACHGFAESAGCGEVRFPCIDDRAIADERVTRDMCAAALRKARKKS